MKRAASHEEDLRMAQAMNRMMYSAQQMDGARSVVVNRTHRVVRDQAIAMRERKRQSRDLMAPLSLFTILMLVLCYAVWSMLDAYNLTPNGVPDASDQISLLLLWSLPVTALVLGLVWLKRERNRAGSHNEVQQ